VEHNKIAQGLNVLLSETRRHADSFPKKVSGMQRHFLRDHAVLYPLPGEIEQLDYHLRAALYKFYLATLSLEQLWSLSHTKRDQIADVLENGLDHLDCTDDELLLISFVFEGFLFQARSFLDFYMIYLCIYFRAGHTGSMSFDKFKAALERVPQGPSRQKAETILTYYGDHVMGQADARFALSPNNWGLLIRSLRDKIAHRDVVRPSFDGDERLIDKVLFDWPTLQRLTYDRFCQYMQNGMFALVTDVSPVLYEIAWISGPYREEMFDNPTP
jgi:hypothetical protein